MDAQDERDGIGWMDDGNQFALGNDPIAVR